MSDHYNLLGVPPAASAEQLRRAFRREAKRCHPDLHIRRPPAEREALQRRFIQLAQAYQVLSDPERRAAYDRQRAAERPRRDGGLEERTGPRAARASVRPSGAARAASAPPSEHNGGRSPAETRPAPDVAGIRREAERSLAAFGLELRHPAEAALEHLLDWALELYRELAAAIRPDARAGPRPERAQEPNQPHSSRQTGAARGTSVPHGDGPKEPALERELARLKRDARSGGRSRSQAPTVDDELAELKRKHGRTPRGSG